MSTSDVGGARPLGQRLLETRAERGLTQERLARAITSAGAAAGVDLTLTPSAISRWETGRHAPALRYRPFLAQALGVEVGELFDAATGPTRVGTGGSPPTRS